MLDSIIGTVSEGELFAKSMYLSNNGCIFENREEMSLMCEVLRGDSETEKSVECRVIRGICRGDRKSILVIFSGSFLFKSQEIISAKRSIILSCHKSDSLSIK